ncbi:MAG: hypothetical protein ACREDL_23980 [Bradyrhizobium sp.]
MRTLTAVMLAGLALMMPAAEAAGPATVTGTLSLKLTIKIASNIPASTPIQCSLSAEVYGPETVAVAVYDSISESDTLTATRNGATAVCKMVIPYQWILYDTGDTVDLSYSVNTLNDAKNGRDSSVSFDTIAVPRNGATTAFSLTARI